MRPRCSAEADGQRHRWGALVSPPVTIDTEERDGESLSYSYRDHPETPGEVLWNRVSVTAGLFVTAMGAAFLLGRKR